MPRLEFLKNVRKRSFLNELIYAFLNVALAVGVLFIVLSTESVWFALLLVIISKWRVFAVRPRYWWANLQSNMVDFIVSVSMVVHMDLINEVIADPSSRLALMVGLTFGYIAWLLFVKPRSKRSFVVAQAGAAAFLGMSALFVVSYGWPVSLVVATAWMIGYSSSRHILSAYDGETHGFFLGLASGVFVAEVAWVAYHWSIAYPLPFFPSLMIPQATLLVTLAGFLGYKAYDSFYHHSKIRMTDIILPLLFSVSVTIVLLTVFNRVGTAI